MNHPDHNSTPRFRGRRIAWRHVLLAVFMCLPLAQANLPGQISSRDAKFRTDFIQNFTKYISWPLSAFDDSQSPFVIGVFGSSPLDGHLQLFAKSGRVAGRTVQFVRFNSIDACRNCHLLYVPTTLDTEQGNRLTAALRGTHVLAIGEDESILMQGGTIRFFSKDGLLNLKVSVGTAAARGLMMRSQLLRLDVVHRVN